MLRIIFDGEIRFASNIECIVSEWAFRFFISELSNNISKITLAWLLIFCLHNRSTRLTKLVLEAGVDVSEAVLGQDGFSPIHALVAEGLPNSSISSIGLLVQSGADLHLVGQTTGYGLHEASPFATPTSIAMRRSLTFFKWRRFVQEQSCNLEDFVSQEIRAGPLKISGWTKNTLLFLFKYEFQPIDLGRVFCACGREVFLVFTSQENWWQATLDKIKNGVTDQERIVVDIRNLVEEPQTEALCWKCNWNCDRERIRKYQRPGTLDQSQTAILLKII
jgi:hypothetical protein